MMANFMEQYQNELTYQEIRSNRYTIKGYCWFLMATAFMWLLTVTGFFEVDKRLITIAFLSNLVLFVPAIVVYCKSNLSDAWIKYFLLSLICVGSAVIVSFLSFHAVLL